MTTWRGQRRGATSTRSALHPGRWRERLAESELWRTRNIVFFLAAVGMCFTLGPLMRYCKNHRYFAVRSIDIEGLERLDASRVRMWLGMVEGSSIWSASPQVLEARLEAQAMIADADVRRHLPNRVLVHVRERRPRALLRAGDAFYLVDRAGTVLEVVDVAAGDLPIISLDVERWRDGHAERDTPELPLPRELREAVRVTQLFEDGLAGIRISEVALRPGQPGEDDPEVVAFSEDGRLAMELGWGSWRDKLRSLRKVLAHASAALSGDPAADVAEEVAVGRLAGSVDVRDPRSVVARWARTSTEGTI